MSRSCWPAATLLITLCVVACGIVLWGGRASPGKSTLNEVEEVNEIREKNFSSVEVIRTNLIIPNNTLEQTEHKAQNETNKKDLWLSQRIWAEQQNQNSTFIEGTLGRRCAIIYGLPYTKKLGCGCVSCAYLSTWKNKSVVVKRVSTKQCRLGDLRKLFMNQIEWAKLNIDHPNLEKIYGYCERPTNPAIVLEFMERGRLRLDRYKSVPLHTKLPLVYGVAQLMNYLGTRSLRHPGSPYTLCDYATHQFSFHNGRFVLMDFDMVIPMRRSNKYHVTPGLELHMGSWVGGRIYVNRHCKEGQHCFTNCLFGWKQKLHELICQSTNYTTRANHTRTITLCPGLGMKASVAMLGFEFLNFLLKDEDSTQELRTFIKRCTAYFEEKRPTLLEVVEYLESFWQTLSNNQTYLLKHGISIIPSFPNKSYSMPPAPILPNEG